LDRPANLHKVGIVGLGYVGLPLSQLFVKKGHTVFGIDSNSVKIEKLLKHQSYLSDMTRKEIREMFASGRFSAGNSYRIVSDLDVMIICVPTPVDDAGNPVLTYVVDAVKSMLPYLHEGQLVVLESSTYPGTVEELLQPLLVSAGFKIGTNLFLAYSPERIDPGQTNYRLEDIPKIVGGVTPQCTANAKKVYESVFPKVLVVSSPRAAEMTKLLENTQRFINISFMNDLVKLCDAMKINLWEVIAAASTKPYGFTPYYPGPGIGGHCIPVDPLYLLWAAEKYHIPLPFIELSRQVNDQMPELVVLKVAKCLNDAQRSIAESRILVVGVTYKKNVNDVRESPAVVIMEKLLQQGAQVHYHDPYIAKLELHDGTILNNTPLTARNVQKHDCVLILTDHTNIPYASIAAYSPFIIDTRNATALLPNRNHIYLFGGMNT